MIRLINDDDDDSRHRCHWRRPDQTRQAARSASPAQVMAAKHVVDFNLHYVGLRVARRATVSDYEVLAVLQAKHLNRKPFHCS